MRVYFNLHGNLITSSVFAFVFSAPKAVEQDSLIFPSLVAW